MALTLFACILALLLEACGPAWSPVDKGGGRGAPYGLTDEGRYVVRKGDSLYTIAFRFGLDWRDLATWNGIRAPYTIYPGQELKLSAPERPVTSDIVARPARSPAGSATAEREPEPRPAPPTGGQDRAGTGAKPSAPTATAPAVQGTQTADPDRWLWPTDGRVLRTFKASDSSRNGIDIAGSEGQPVTASAAGEVVYSGSGLIGYGELIIAKHSDRMLSAYAHNRKRLVSEGQRVTAGEVVAEMGRNDRNQAMLHFEIRINGTPQDPLKFLPKR